MNMKNIIYDLPIPFPHINVKFAVFVLNARYYEQNLFTCQIQFKLL